MYVFGNEWWLVQIIVVYYELKNTTYYNTSLKRQKEENTRTETITSRKVLFLAAFGQLGLVWRCLYFAWFIEIFVW